MDQRQDRPVGRLKQVVIDCATPSALARFWAAALDGFEVRPYDDDEVARLALLGRGRVREVERDAAPGLLVVFCRIRRGPFVEGLRVRQRAGQRKGHRHDWYVGTRGQAVAVRSGCSDHR
jgi:hypothetical protein